MAEFIFLTESTTCAFRACMSEYNVVPATISHSLRIHSGFTRCLALSIWHILLIAPLMPAQTGGAVKPVALVAPVNASFALAEDGSLWAWGDTALLPNQPGKSPAKLTGLPAFTKMAASDGHVLAIQAGGTLWAWGQGQDGQLGDGTREDRAAPVEVNLGGSPAVAVAAGRGVSFAVDATGALWAWGRNTDGYLGDGSGLTRDRPVLVTGLPGVAAVAVGASHTLARCVDGTVWAWGVGEVGQLGHGALQGSLMPVQVSGLSGVIAIAAGVSHSLAVKSDGTVWAWGSGAEGRLGDGQQANRSTPVQVQTPGGMTAVAAGNSFSLARRNDGTVWSWGAGSLGQLGHADIGPRLLPEQITRLSGIVSVVAGEQHGLALGGDGQVWAWGRAGRGQLGTGVVVTAESAPVRTVRLGPPDLVLLLATSLQWQMGKPGALAMLVENVGQSPANGVTTVTSPLPSGLEFLGAMGEGWSCGAAGGVLTCTNPETVEAGGVLALTVKFGTTPGVPFQVQVTATVENPSDTNETNGTAAHWITLSAPTSISIGSITPSPALVGQPVTVTYSVTSAYGTPTSGVQVSDGTVSNVCTSAAGQCTMPGTHLPGPKTVTAAYIGSQWFQHSVAQVEHRVDPVGTSTTVVWGITPSPSVVGQQYIVAFTVTPDSGLPTGEVTVSDGVSANTCWALEGSCRLISMTAGAKTITAVYRGNTNHAGSSGTRAHTVNAAAQAVTRVVSVAPASGEGPRQMFKGVYRSPAGYQRLQWVQMLFAQDPTGGGEPYCLLHYDVQGQGFWLYSDTMGFFMGPVTPGAASADLQGSLCALSTSGSSVSGAGTDLEVNLDLVFKGILKARVYLRAMDLGGHDTGWVQLGAWESHPAPWKGGEPGIRWGAGYEVDLTVEYPDPPGFEGLAKGWVQFLVTTPMTAPFCYLHYDRAGNGLWMYSSDVGYFLGPVQPGTATMPLESSACSIDTVGTRVRQEGGVLLLDVRARLKGTMRGPSSMRLRSMDALGRDTGWELVGQWHLP